MPLDLFEREKRRNFIGKWNEERLLFKTTRNVVIADSFLTATSKSSSPLVPWRIFTRFPILFSQMYRACCRAEPATIYSPSPEKQHFFHGVLRAKTASQVKRLNNSRAWTSEDCGVGLFFRLRSYILPTTNNS